MLCAATGSVFSFPPHLPPISLPPTFLKGLLCASAPPGAEKAEETRPCPQRSSVLTWEARKEGYCMSCPAVELRVECPGSPGRGRAVLLNRECPRGSKMVKASEAVANTSFLFSLREGFLLSISSLDFLAKGNLPECLCSCIDILCNFKIQMGSHYAYYSQPCLFTLKLDHGLTSVSFCVGILQF